MASKLNLGLINRAWYLLWWSANAWDISYTPNLIEKKKHPPYQPLMFNPIYGLL